MIGEKSLLHSKPLDYKTEGHLEPLSNIARAQRVLVPTASGVLLLGTGTSEGNRAKII